MAAAGDIQDLSNEATCPICLEYFNDPVSIAKCGHNFCRRCLNQSMGQKESSGLMVTCPQCRGQIRRRNLVPNRTLKSLVEKLSQAPSVCQTHKEPLKLFCKDHQAPICVVCFTSKEHENHRVVPQEEACQEYKDQICSRMEILKAEKEKVLMYKVDLEKESQDPLKQTGKKRQKTKAAFQQMHQFLEEQEKIHLAQIEELEKEIKEPLARVGRKLSSLESLIEEMEEKSQQPASEFLQDIKENLQRYEKEEPSENPVAFPPELICRIKRLYDVKPLLKRVMKPLKAKAKVTLDADTAHPELILSQDHKHVRWGDEEKDLPNNPERFDYWEGVLGSEGFTAGRHFWEVTVGREGRWAVGVARNSVKRKGRFSLSPEEGIWAVGKRRHSRLFTSDSTRLSLKQKLKRIRVTLNCAEGQVSFSDADSGVHIYTFSGASFRGETLLPFFWVDGEAHLRHSS